MQEGMSRKSIGLALSLGRSGNHISRCQHHRDITLKKSQDHRFIVVRYLLFAFCNVNAFGVYKFIKSLQCGTHKFSRRGLKIIESINFIAVIYDIV